MKTAAVRLPTASSLLISAALLAAVPATGFAQSLSAALGATKLDGLTNFANCQNQVAGFRERTTGERLEAKLAKSPALTAEQRAVWQADATALKAVTVAMPKFNPPNPKDPQHYMLGLTPAEQQSINSMVVRFGQEINLECEKKYGGMTRYSPTSDQSGQKKYEDSLRAKFITPIEISTVALTVLPNPFPKTQEEVAAEERAVRQAQIQSQRAATNNAMQGMVAKMTACQEEVKPLRLNLQADYMQRVLDGSPSLAAKERADFEADIKAVRAAAVAGLDMPAPVDPANPFRGMMRLPAEMQMAMAGELGTKMSQQIIACQSR
jgi:hypothetical protein